MSLCCILRQSFESTFPLTLESLSNNFGSCCIKVHLKIVILELIIVV